MPAWFSQGVGPIRFRSSLTLDVNVVEIKVRKNGSILVSGKVKLTGPDDQEIILEKETFALCRCGESANKPFCDGAHKRCGFSPDE
jgi:CDGSH-type Zn-finger protein